MFFVSLSASRRNAKAAESSFLRLGDYESINHLLREDIRIDNSGGKIIMRNMIMLDAKLKKVISSRSEIQICYNRSWSKEASQRTGSWRRMQLVHGPGPKVICWISQERPYGPQRPIVSFVGLLRYRDGLTMEDIVDHCLQWDGDVRAGKLTGPGIGLIPDL